MSYRVPESPDSIRTSSSTISTADEFYPTIDYTSDYAVMSDVQMSEEQVPTSPTISLTQEDINKILSLVTALKDAPPEAQDYVKQLIEGKQPSAQEVSGGKRGDVARNSNASNGVSESREIMKMDAKFEKWDGKSLSWTPHYYFLKAQCRVYQPLLVTEEAVCLKIYESIPEPQRQRIRGYWIRCGEQEKYNWKEMLEICHKEYFDQIEAQKAERKLLAMRQGESQIFRKFLQDWELQLEFAGGREWPDSIKINQIRTAVNEKIRDKFAVLGLPMDNYQAWVQKITEVAAIMEDNENFVKKGEAQTTQFASRSGALQSEYLTNTVQNSPPHKPASGTIDQDGDTVMGGMKLDLNSLATLIAKISDREKEACSKEGQRTKKSAPWRTEKEVAELRERNICIMSRIRYKKHKAFQ